jgi:F-type H+-transporting ATPase subunit epsilon
MAISIEQQAQIKATHGAPTVGGTSDMSFQPGQDHRLRCVIVTPEKAVLDDSADFIVLPMIDGELGVLPQHAAVIGRLGTGELRITKGNTVQKWRVGGGFAQVRSNVVTVLTGRAALGENA